MKCIEILMDEHKLILKAMETANRMAQAFFDAKKVHKDDLDKILQFIKNYADHLHHKKEEDVLFTWMKNHGFPIHSGPIVCMMIEHDVGRNHVKTIEEELIKGNLTDPKTIEVIVSSMIDIASHLENHIFKENNVLYPMITNMLDEESDAEIVRGYSEKINDSDKLRINQHYKKLLKDLDNKYL